MLDYPNLDRLSRQLHRVCGRCLVQTNSISIDFVNNEKTQTVPLFHNGFHLTFSHANSFICELDGWLSVESGSVVEIITLGPYDRAYFDARSVTMTQLSSDTSFKVVALSAYSTTVGVGTPLSYLTRSVFCDRTPRRSAAASNLILQAPLVSSADNSATPPQYVTDYKNALEAAYPIGSFFNIRLLPLGWSLQSHIT